MPKYSYWVVQIFRWKKGEKERVKRSEADYMGPYKTYAIAHKRWGGAVDREPIRKPYGWKPKGKQRWTTLTGKLRKRKQAKFILKFAKYTNLISKLVNQCIDRKMKQKVKNCPLLKAMAQVFYWELQIVDKYLPSLLEQRVLDYR